MMMRQYVEARGEREPTFTIEVRAAAAEFDLGEALARRREERGMSVAELAAASGIAPERLERIDEGDSMTVREVLLLLHVLETSISVDHDFTVNARSLTAVTPR